MKQKRKTPQKKQRKLTLKEKREPYRYISMLSDYGFKKTFGNEKDTLFLRRALEILIQIKSPIVEIQFMKNEMAGLTVDGRSGIYDISCKDKNGQVYIIEMQLNDFKHFIHRGKFYAFHSFNTMVQKGNYRFDDLNRIYVISFLAGKTYKTNEFFQVGQLRNQHGELMDAQITHIVIELGKWNKKEEEIENDLDKLLYLMKMTETAKKTDPTHYPIFLKEKWIREVMKELDLINMSPEQRQAYEMTMVRNAANRWAIEKEIKEGVEEETKLIQEEMKKELELLEQRQIARENLVKQKLTLAEQKLAEEKKLAEQKLVEEKKLAEQKLEKMIKNLILLNRLSLEQIAVIAEVAIEKVQAIDAAMKEEKK